MSHTTRTLAVGQLEQLQNNIERLEPLFQAGPEETWTAREIEGDNKAIMGSLRFACRTGAIQKVGKVQLDREDGSGHSDIRNQYEWRTAVREDLIEYLQDRNELPCGHKAHVFNHRDVEGLSCKYCIEEGRKPQYDKETVRECL